MNNKEFPDLDDKMPEPHLTNNNEYFAAERQRLCLHVAHKQILRFNGSNAALTTLINGRVQEIITMLDWEIAQYHKSKDNDQ